MLKEQRHARILQVLRDAMAATIGDLSDAVGVSDSTVRRDLRVLSEHGLVRLTHGGAVLTESHFSSFELDSELAAATESQAKASLGVYAATQILTGQTVLFDSSSTVLAAAREIARRKSEITAITNSLQIAEVLAASRSIAVIVVGGSVRRGSATLYGNPGLAFLNELHVDLALLGTHSVSGALLTETSQDVVAMKRAMIHAARHIILLADSTKFRPPALFTICGVEDIDEIVTNSDASHEALSIVKEAGVAVTTV
ncbi:DeoR/GlpR family DNA-binding transcription regulator [Silicimonas algicola]|uniref:DeoR family transcriptional regulator n=1 Tax=Silicimonas algicola TaxID=1826607 RepID=A0A316GDZ3_9RHOB|nr:DeoR/GlpR family DNA-binding transcription regulator [Silicimonas algicola]PWK57600.1 DeoR family transcriptional regulator [Silicimonas algicola]